MAGTSFPFPIDAVYTWVDGTDPQWQENRRILLEKTTGTAAPLPEALAKARFQDNDELRFSLRSIAMFAPWIRHVYIITAKQQPAWLNPKHASIIHHETIFPEQRLLPVFSNRPIELCVHRIPGLAEHFIYFNDDFMLGKALQPQDFFQQDGLPRLWAVHRSRKKVAALLRRTTSGSSHITAVARAHQLILDHYGTTTPITMRHFPKSMTVSGVYDLWNTFAPAVQQTLASPFRSTTDISITMLYPLYMLAEKKAVLRPINGIQQVKDFFCGGIAHMGTSLGDHNFTHKLRRIRLLKPLTFCLNDAPGSTDEDKRLLHEFLTACFPTPSKFELAMHP